MAGKSLHSAGSPYRPHKIICVHLANSSSGNISAKSLNVNDLTVRLGIGAPPATFLGHAGQAALHALLNSICILVMSA